MSSGDPVLPPRPPSGPGRPPDRAFSLYFQCAAMPYSAVRCMSCVRICSSTGLPCGPMTVVCSDWYMLNFGIATKSLKIGRHTSELQSRQYLVCRLLLEKKKNNVEK